MFKSNKSLILLTVMMLVMSVVMGGAVQAQDDELVELVFI